MKRKIGIVFAITVFIVIIAFSKNVSAIQVEMPKEGFLIDEGEIEGFIFDDEIENISINQNLEENIKNPEVDVKNYENNMVLAESANENEFAYATISGGYNFETYVTTDNKNDYEIKNTAYTNGGGYYEIVKHDIKNNTNTTIYKSEIEYYAKQRYVRNNIIYIEQAIYTEYNNGNSQDVQILAFDTKTEKVLYVTGNLTVPMDKGDQFHTFVVDSKERFYIEYNYTGVKVYNKSGKLIYDREPIKNESSTKYQIVLHSVAPNDDGIIFSQGYYNYPPYAYLRTLHQGYQKLKSDGTFYYNDYTLFSKSPSDYLVKDPDWKFLDNNYAVNQYGEIGKFNYFTPDDKSYTGCKIEIVDTTLRNVSDSYDGHLFNPVYFVKDNKLYLIGSNSIIFIFDKNNNYTRVGKINTNININENSRDEIHRMSCIDDKIYIHYYDSSETTYNKRNKEKIVNLNSIEQFKNIWITEHSTQKHTKAQIIAKYNETKLKFDYSKSQYDANPSYKAPYAAGKLKAAVITDTLNQINYYRWLYGINEITINQDKMERSQKGAVIQAATNQLTHNPKKPDDMDEDFYKEAYAGCNAKYEKGDIYSGNCAFGDISCAKAIEGFISDINNVSIGSYVGHRLSLLNLDSDRTSFGYCNKYTALSMYTREDGVDENNEKFYSYPSAGYFPMQNFYTNEYWSFKCMENYNIKDMKIEFTYNNKTYTSSRAVENGAIVFKMPDELIQALGNKTTMPKCKINVKLTGLKDDNGDTTNFSYDVNFFDINEILIKGISFKNKEEIGYEKRSLNAQNIIINPSNATEEYEIKWSSSNTAVATIDSTGKITCKKIGKTTITAKVGKFTASYTLNVKEAPSYTLGDVNEDGKVNAKDATLILKYMAKKATLTENQLLAADTDRDGKIKASDAVKILKYVTKKINEL